MKFTQDLLTYVLKDLSNFITDLYETEYGGEELSIMEYIKNAVELYIEEDLFLSSEPASEVEKILVVQFE